MADCRGVPFACGHPLSEPNPQCGAEYPPGQGHPVELVVDEVVEQSDSQSPFLP